MKTLLHFTVTFLLMLPVMLVFNDSENIWLNVIGLAYILLLYILSSKTRTGRKLFLSIYRSLNRR